MFLTKEQHDDLEIINSLFWKSEYRKGVELCLPNKNSSPLFYSLLARFHWLRAFISENEAEAEEALRLLDEAQDCASNSIKRKSSRTTQNLQDQLTVLCARAVIAECTLFEATLKFRIQQYVRGVVAFRKSWKSYFECLSLIRPLERELNWIYDHNEKENTNHPANKDEPVERRMFRQVASIVYTGAALFHYLIDLIPKHFKWIVEGLGFQADRELAMREFRQSVSCKNSLSGPTSVILLISILVFWEEKKADAMEILTEYEAAYPTGEPFSYLGGYLYRQYSNIEKSISLFEKTMNFTEIRQLSLYCSAEIGYNYYLDCQWDKAIVVLERFLKESQIAGYKCFMYYALGISYEMNNQHQVAVETLKCIQPLVRKGFSLDEYSGKRSQVFLERNGLSETERVLIQVNCIFEALKYQQCIEFIQNIPNFKEMSSPDKGRLFYWEGSSYLKLAKYDEAEDRIKKVISLEPELISSTELWVLPFSYCTLAETFIEKKQLNEAKELLKKSTSFSKYEFESWLIARSKRALERIKRVEKESNPLLLK